MNIYVDESGSFANTTTPNSWCVIAAYVSPESDRKSLANLLGDLKRKVDGYPKEVKLGMLDETRYFEFILQLGRLSGTVFVAATDMSQNLAEIVVGHRQTQGLKVIEHIDKMRHQSMKDSLSAASKAILEMPPNLYVQMVFQISLFHEVVVKSTLYYVQRTPQLLRELRWRVDQKDTRRTGYENTFRQLLPSVLQSMSISEPLLMLEGCDYSHMVQYEYPPGEQPKYLTEEYGLPASDGFNIGKMVGGNFTFVDSKSEVGVQVADLVASGFRRLLKGEFLDNDRAAILLGRLCIKGYRGKVPLKLFTMGDEQVVQSPLADRLHLLQKYAKPMLR